MARISLSSAKHKSITGISSSRASNNYNNYNYLAIDCRMPIVSPMEESWGSECPCPMPVLTSNSRPASRLSTPTVLTLGVLIIGHATTNHRRKHRSNHKVHKGAFAGIVPSTYAPSTSVVPNPMFANAFAKKKDTARRTRRQNQLSSRFPTKALNFVSKKVPHVDGSVIINGYIKKKSGNIRDKCNYKYLPMCFHYLGSIPWVGGI